MRSGATITRGKQGASVAGKPWRVSCLLTTGVAVAGKLALGTVYKLTSVNDCDALGLNAAYDTTNNVVVYQHIADFYDEGNEGVPLYLMVVAQSVTLAQMLDDTGNIYAKKLAAEAAGTTYIMAVGFNPATGYTETMADGINAEVRAGIAKAQALWQWSVDNFREFSIILEGRAYGGNQTTAADLRALPATPSGIESNHKVTVCIGQDYDFAHTLSGLAQKYAGIGKLLGTWAAADLNQDVSEVGDDTRSLTKAAKGRWKTAGLSNHTRIDDSATDAQLSTLDTKGYVFADLYVGVSGYRWNGDHVCAPKIIDAEGNMNEFKMALGRTMNHASRMLRSAMLPFVHSRVDTDITTGNMTVGAVKFLEGKGDEVFEDMKADGHCADGETIVDPLSDVKIAEEVNVSFNLFPVGYAGKITGIINLKSRK